MDEVERLAEMERQRRQKEQEQRVSSLKSNEISKKIKPNLKKISHFSDY